MRKLLFMLLAAMWFSAAPAMAQLVNEGTITASASTCTSAGGARVTLELRPDAGSASITLKGTWVGTVEFQGAADGNNYSSILGDPLPSGGGASSATANGTWVFNIAALTHVCVRASTYTSGTIQVKINSSPAFARNRSFSDLDVAVLNKVRNCNTFSGAEAGAKLAACYADLPSTGGMGILSDDMTLSTAVTITIVAGKPLILDLAGRTLTFSHTSGVGLTFTESGLNPRTPLTIRNGVVRYSGSSINVTGISLSNKLHIVMENLRIEGFNTTGAVAIDLSGATGVEDSEFRAITFTGNMLAVNISKDSNQNRWSSVWFQDNVNAVLLTDASGNTFENCLVQSSTGTNPFKIVATTQSVSGININGCWFEENGDATANASAIYLEAAAANSIVHFTVQNSVFNPGTGGASGVVYRFTGAGSLTGFTRIGNGYNGTVGAFHSGLVAGQRITSMGETFGGAMTGLNFADTTVNSDGVNLGLANATFLQMKDSGGTYQNILTTDGGNAVTFYGYQGRSAIRGVDGATYVYAGDAPNTQVARINIFGIGLFALPTVRGIALEGNSASTIDQQRHTTANTAGTNLTINGGGATSGATDKNGGNLIIRGGTATGSGSSQIQLQTATAGASGTADRTPTTKLTLDGNGNFTFAGAPTASMPTAAGSLNYDTTTNHFAGGDGTAEQIPWSSEILDAAEGTGIPRSDGVSWSISELSGGCVTSGSNVTVCVPATTSAKTGTYQMLASDFPPSGCGFVPVTSGTFTMTLVASASQPASGRCAMILNYGTGIVTLARSGQNINGAAADLTGTAGSASAPTGWRVTSDGTNYIASVIGESALTQTMTGKTLDVEGTGNSITTTHYVTFPAANCQNATAGLGFSTPTTNAPAAACITGTNTQRGVADFDASTDESVQAHLPLPPDWTGNIDLDLRWQAAATSGSVVWGFQTICVAVGETGDPAFNAAQTVTDAAQGTANWVNDAAITTVTVTGCAANEELFFNFYRDANNVSDDMTGDARLIWVRLKLRRTQ